jgi:SAM-dependent methyltransferase
MMFPRAPIWPLGERPLDVLIAGCGTGQHSIGMARRYRNVRVLAVDLSLSSLAYAQRMTRELGVPNIEYAQADVMALRSIGRTFDLIDASGVLHHLSDPADGWRILLQLLRPGGLMRVGLYSRRGRADVVAAREFIAQRGFQPTAGDIRRCRQELLASSLGTVARFPDFFSTSDCRDLLFHVQEHRFDIPQIAAFLAANKLTFIGFEPPSSAAIGGEARPDGPNLEAWDAFERDHPEAFSGMYQFWCQRT